MEKCLKGNPMRYLLVLLFVFSLAACDTTNEPQPTPAPIPIPEPTPDPNPEPTPNPEPNGTLGESFGEKGLVIFGTEENSEVASDAALLSDGTVVVVGSRTDSLPEASEGDVSLVLFFSSDGTLKRELTFPDRDADVVAVQKNGDIMIAGRGTNPATNEFVFWLRRLKADGTLDVTFGDEGVVYTTQSGFLADLVLDDVGRIILGGFRPRAVGSGDVIQLLRFTPEGTPDTSFGENGVIITEIEQDNRLNALTFDARGRIIAVGFTRTLDALNGSKFLVLRYDQNGKPDTFGPIGQGFNTVDFGESGGEASAVTLDKEGHILAAGGQSVPSSFILARLELDGFPDETFGPNKKGQAVFGFGQEVQGLVPDSKNRILLAGIEGSVTVDNPQAPPRGNEALLAVRLDPDGNLDKSYGVSGGRIVKLELPGTNVLASIEATLLDQGQGLILVARRLNFATEDSEIVLTRIR